MPQNVVPELREGILLWKHYVVINDIVSIVKVEIYVEIYVAKQKYINITCMSISILGSAHC